MNLFFIKSKPILQNEPIRILYPFHSPFSIGDLQGRAEPLSSREKGQKGLQNNTRLDFRRQRRRKMVQIPLGSTKKEVTFVYQKLLLFLSKPQAWHTITTQSCISSAPMGLDIITAKPWISSRAAHRPCISSRASVHPPGASVPAADREFCRFA